MAAANQDKPFYLETSEKLSVRIQAHTQFTNLQLEDWFAAELRGAAGKHLLEIGCGDGNFFPTYSNVLGPQGEIVGLDVNADLIERARKTGQALGTPTTVQTWDFDHHPFPVEPASMDFVLAPFSAYYTKDATAWIDDALRVLAPGGRLILLGPTKENAEELYQLNELVTGIASVAETDTVSGRLEAEFLPILQGHPELQVESLIIERDIEFPTSDAFARYYFATWLNEKTQQRTGRAPGFEEVVHAVDRIGRRLNKKVACIKASKS
jgi:ubiquinone/menaquinone biosynthesis C-methylase UbiE